MLRDSSHLGPDYLARFWQSPTPYAQAASAATSRSADDKVVAYVNEGRWIVDCPDCSGAQYANRSDRRFMCNECANVTIGGLWRPVVWPPAKTEQSIEKALAPRPPRNAHWLPGETVADLLAENVEHGVG